MVGVRSYNHVFINSRAKKWGRKERVKVVRMMTTVPNSGKPRQRNAGHPSISLNLNPPIELYQIGNKKVKYRNGEFMCKSQSSDSECSLSGYSGPCWSGIPWQVLHKIFSIVMEDVGALPFLCRFVYWSCAYTVKSLFRGHSDEGTPPSWGTFLSSISLIIL